MGSSCAVPAANDGRPAYTGSAARASTSISAPLNPMTNTFGAEIDFDALATDPVYAGLPSFAAGTAHELPTWTVRGDYHEAMALLDVVEEQFS